MVFQLGNDRAGANRILDHIFHQVSGVADKTIIGREGEGLTGKVEFRDEENKLYGWY